MGADVAAADVVEREDVRMIQSCGGTRFPLEPLKEVAVRGR